MAAAERLPHITVGISPTASRGVALASYSGRLSRMWCWDTESLAILGYQDVKAAVELLDISKDGKYCAYSAIAHHKDEHYIAISRPPYFHALWLREMFHIHLAVVIFGDDGIVRFHYEPRSKKSRERFIQDSVTPGAPFQFQSIKRLEDWNLVVTLAAGRCSGALGSIASLSWSDEPFRRPWFGTDSVGRKIEVQGSSLTADGIPFLDCQRSPFEAVPPADWALSW